MATAIYCIRTALALFLVLLVAACGESEDKAAAKKPIVRGLKTVLVQNEERSTIRKYPSVLQPDSITTLSFEVAGKLAAINLDVGQIVKKGDVLARIDPTTLTLQVESAQAALAQATSAARTTSEDYQRKTTLLKKGVVTQSAADQSRNSAESAKAELVQVGKQLETARENLKKAVLKAPFNGIINSVETVSFTTLAAGAAVATIYSAENFEASFSVSYEVINMLAVGKKAVVRLADNPAISLNAHVSEIGARADTVSSFPVVTAMDTFDPNLKAGMAVEVSLKFAVKRGKGFLLPLTVLALEGRIRNPKNNDDQSEAFIYVFDEATSTVKRRSVTIAGVRENALIIIDGLKLGERVASAGVSFLRDGQTVKLLPNPVPE